MEKVFGLRLAHISSIISTFREAFYRMSLPYLSNPNLFLDRIPYYASLVRNKSDMAIDKVWGFIDGTLRKTCRPTYFQKAAYSGHKRCHGLKFQLVLAPNGLFVSLFGPVAGSRHDLYLLGQSNLLDQLREMMPDPFNAFALYGDPAYPQSTHILGPFINPPGGSINALWNSTMSRVRIVVEWGFKEVISSWRYLDFRASMKVFEAPIAQYFFIGVFLTNCRNCFYGSQIQVYFDARTLNIDKYINLV